jgi:uncharacterized protein (DUF1684 family)
MVLIVHYVYDVIGRHSVLRRVIQTLTQEDQGPIVMKRMRIFLVLIMGVPFLIQGTLLFGQDRAPWIVTSQKQKVMKWKRERDAFFKTHERSPLSAGEKRSFRALKYYPFNPQYVLHGPIERYIFHISNPEYYATFLTNRGTNKRYIRYGKFRFKLDGREYTVQIYKSILSDALFIPFKDLTSGKETYGGGRYVDAEILPGYKMVLDFNMAYYPSCAYSEKFVCVLPPEENMLNVKIQAGERNK